MPTMPSCRLSGKRRPFPKIVTDLRHAVFSVIRHRPVQGTTNVNAVSLGSGFFVSRDVFLTCDHVINSTNAPHQPGDWYELVNNLGNGNGVVHRLRPATVGQTVHLFPHLDLCLLILGWQKDQAWVPLEYGDVPTGTDMGVAGYPLPTLGTVNNALAYDGLIFRVARGVVTATHTTNLQTNQQTTLANIPVVEVNFLFVPGNSGGPIFNAETGRVFAFVHGYRAETINQRVQQATQIQALPPGLGPAYIESLHAIYSIGIKLENARSTLEGFGVTL